MVGHVIEDTYYPVLMEQIKKQSGATSVSQVKFNSVPDIVFELPQLPNSNWLLSVKIGEDPRTLTSAFIQFQRHKEESGYNYGMMLFLPQSARNVRPKEQALQKYIEDTQVWSLIDTPWVKEENHQLPFPELIKWLVFEVTPKVRNQASTPFSINTILTFLRQHVLTLMSELELEERELLGLITNEKLFSHFSSSDSIPKKATQFLAAYTFLSQVLFFHLFAKGHPEIVPPKEITRTNLRKAFRQILSIDYKQVYEIDVLDDIPDQFLKDTYILLQGLAVDRVRADIAGRLFHDLMPPEVKKLLAAFYTRPQAADILAALTVTKPNESIWDPACGSGTILVAGYRRKAQLHSVSGSTATPHRRFIEQDLYGADIMPFAVTLTSANLASLDPETTVENINVIRVDSLGLVGGHSHTAGVQLSLLPDRRSAEVREGNDRYEVVIEPKDVVMMNPPFTKLERGIAQWVNLSTYQKRIGKESGLWAHFIALVDQILLRNGGNIGAVLPISLLRGRETQAARSLCFEEFTPLYVLKPTLNYAFSEWSEYRDILFIAKKEKPPKEHLVKFALIKSDLTKMTTDDSLRIADLILAYDQLRDEMVDIDSVPMNTIKKSISNLMPFCGVSDLSHRDKLQKLASRLDYKLNVIPSKWFKTGVRFEGGQAEAVVFGRERKTSRTAQSALSFSKESQEFLLVKTSLGREFIIETSLLLPALRTAIGIRKLEISNEWDYIATMPYKAVKAVERALGKTIAPQTWMRIEKEATRSLTNVCIARRINPFSPSTSLLSFYADKSFVPTDVFHAIHTPSNSVAKALAAICNSVIFLAQWFLGKEETGGRYIDLRLYDLEKFKLLPPEDKIEAVAEIFDDFSSTEFPPLTHQLDVNFSEHYEAFWSARRKLQAAMFGKLPYEPDADRLAFDQKVCSALGIQVSDTVIRDVYMAIVKEMIITRGLRKD
jgi:type I restriction-modification system DNA methylase subunit